MTTTTTVAAIMAPISRLALSADAATGAMNDAAADATGRHEASPAPRSHIQFCCSSPSLQISLSGMRLTV